jgi:hypothetical protein
MRGGEVPRKRCEMSPSNRAVAPEFGCVKPGPRVPNSGGAIENKGGEKKKKRKKRKLRKYRDNQGQAWKFRVHLFAACLSASEYLVEPIFSLQQPNRTNAAKLVTRNTQRMGGRSIPFPRATTACLSVIMNEAGMVGHTKEANGGGGWWWSRGEKSCGAHTRTRLCKVRR